MSKTKDEILLEKIGPLYPSFQEYLKFASPERAKIKIHEAMDTYAQQKVDEFKKELKYYITELIAEVPTEYGRGRNAMIDRIIKEFEL